MRTMYYLEAVERDGWLEFECQESRFIVAEGRTFPNRDSIDRKR